MSPSGGTSARSGTISITSPRLQNDAGKLGHTIRTLIAGPSGAKTLVSLGSRSMDKPSYLRLLFDFNPDSLRCESVLLRSLRSENQVPDNGVNHALAEWCSQVVRPNLDIFASSSFP